MNRARTMTACAWVTTISAIPFTLLIVVYAVSDWFGYGASPIGRSIMVMSLFVFMGCAAIWVFLAWVTYKPDKT